MNFGKRNSERRAREAKKERTEEGERKEGLKLRTKDNHILFAHPSD